MTTSLAPRREPIIAELPVSAAAITTERRLLLVVLLVIVAGLKVSFNPGLGRNSLDGDFYFQIARHVAEGDGLETSLSLYHQGYKQLPAPTNISPLWPLLLGGAGAVWDLRSAAVALPEVLFLIDLALLYLVANALFASRGRSGFGVVARPSAIVTVGHAAVLLFAFNPVFFEFTSLPYTEALTFCLVLLSLLALIRALGRASTGWAALAGALAGASFLSRAQMIAALIAVPLALAVAARDDRRFVRSALAAAAAGVAVVAPWAVWVGSWARPFHPRFLWSLATYRQTPEVAPFQSRVPVDSLVEWLLDRGGGLAAAFDPGSADSYLASFGPAALLVPLALIRIASRARELRPDLARLASSSGAATLAALLIGLIALVPVHLHHAWYFKEWLFGFRHGLPLMLPLLLALLWLAIDPKRWLRGLTMALVAASVLRGAAGVGRLLATDSTSGLFGPEPELVEWLDEQARGASSVTTQAHTLSVFSRSTFHWMECREEAAKTVALLEHTGARYVLAYPGEERCPFLAGLVRGDAGRPPQLALVREFGAAPMSIRVFSLAGP